MKITTSPRRRKAASALTLIATAVGIFAGCLTASAQMPSDTKLRSSAEVPETPFDAPPGTWTLVVLPDTQFYSKWYPDIFKRQTEWIVKNKERHNIRFVSHLGDITNNCGQYEWRAARRAMDVLNEAKIPYSIVPGNHDIGDRGTADTRETLMNKYFTEADYANNAAFGLFEPGKMENSWHHLDTPSGKYLILALEFYPRNEVLDWANEIVSKNPDRKVILTTHCYLSRDTAGSPLSNGAQGPSKADYLLVQSGNVNDGVEMWEKLVSKHPNFIMTLNGHINGRGHRVSDGSGGQKVHQMLVDYQDSPHDTESKGFGDKRPGYGGAGYLRLYQFSPDGKSVRVRSYSPWFNDFLDDPAEDFTIKF